MRTPGFVSGLSIFACLALTPPALAFDLPGVFGMGDGDQARRGEAASVIQVQSSASDPRIAQLEEQVRRLTGTVEDLNFQMLQLQEQIRRQQEDLEFRLQSLEGGAPSGDSGNSGGSQSGQNQTGPASQQQSALDEAPMGDAGFGELEEADDARFGAPPSDLGTLTLGNDPNGNNPNGNGGAGTDLGQTASITPAEGPQALYDQAEAMLSTGRYGEAERLFRLHEERYPNAENAADTAYGLGQSLYSQQLFPDAAEVFLNASRQYGDSQRAPEILLSLGSTLIAMGQSEVGCETLREVSSRYPQMSPAVSQQLSQERQAGSC